MDAQKWNMFDRWYGIVLRGTLLMLLRGYVDEASWWDTVLLEIAELLSDIQVPFSPYIPGEALVDYRSRNMLRTRMRCFFLSKLILLVEKYRDELVGKLEMFIPLEWNPNSPYPLAVLYHCKMADKGITPVLKFGR